MTHLIFFFIAMYENVPNQNGNISIAKYIIYTGVMSALINSVSKNSAQPKI